ncbi:MAG: sugar phosphate nucleotidyltransferase [Bacteroidia bacterium]|nr:sugar phosphate nucleotidyltransferase [Bacteroidia bacterium]
MIAQTHAVILAGGSGTRFWPLSRASRPKQFLDVLGTKKSLLQSTVERVSLLLPPERIWLSAYRMHQALVESQLGDFPPHRCLYEPLQRNTAPSILWATEVIARQYPDAILWIMPADHFIPDVEAFVQLVRSVLETCDFSEAIYTIGIRPRYPHTGYGYIQFIPKPTLCKPVKTFTEKPSKELAELFIQSGDFLWNSGIFIAHVSVLRRSFSQHAPEIYELFADIDVSDPEAVLKAFQQVPAISFDYAVMEKYTPVAVVEGNFRWWDLGGWNALYEVSAHDPNGNSLFTKAFLGSVKNCLLVSSEPKKVIVVDGLSDYLVVDTPDALLILPRAQEQTLREWVQRLRTEGGSEYV